MRLNGVVAALFIAFPAAAGEGPSLSVQEIRSRLPAGESATVDVAGLADQVREVARRVLPDVRVAESGEVSDLAVTGELVQLEQGYLVSLELRETKSSKLSGAASAAANTPEELLEGVASAAVDLFRGYKAAASLVMAPAGQPTPPAPLGKLEAAGVDANVLVAFDQARAAEAQSADDAAAAWRVASELPGVNPFREIAAARGKEWQAYAESRRAFEVQLARDTARLKKVLPLAAVTDGTKIELLVRYTRAYGAQRAALLFPLVPATALSAAQLSVGCEAKDASMCVALARQAQDPKVAVDYLDQACTAGDPAACTEAGDRFLRAETRDPAKAVASLQRGCAAGGAPACARLARVYEEGDGAAPNRALAAETRDKACTAGDGASCRRLACDVPSELPRAAELWQRGCKAGDSISCALAQVGVSRGDAVARGQVREATAGVRRASTAPPQTATSPAVTAAPAAATETAPATNGHHRAGYALLGIATVVAGGALFIATTGHEEDPRHYDHHWLSAAGDRPSSGGRGLTMVLGAAAVLSAGAGIGLLLSRPDEPKQLSVGVAPSGVVLSGTLP